MNGQGAALDTGFAQEKVYALARQASRQVKEEAETDHSSREISEQASSLTWEAVAGKDGTKTYDLRGNDIVYLSTLATAFAEDEVNALSSRKRLNFKEKVVGVLKEKMIKLAMDAFSHNFFIAEIAKMGVGALQFQLSLLGVSPTEISSVLSEARRKKMEAVNTGIKQLVSEKVLFGIVTGARVA